MKPTTDGRWAHIACAHWVPEATFVDPIRMEPIGARGSNSNCTSAVATIDHIQSWRYESSCAVCKAAHNGAVIKCKHRGCSNMFHPLCGRNAGYYMEFEFDEKRQLVLLTAFCENHTQANRTNEFTGRDVCIWLPPEQVWANARVGMYNPRTKQNKLAYHADGSVEWVHLRAMVASYRRSNPSWSGGGGGRARSPRRARHHFSSSLSLPPTPVDPHTPAAALMSCIALSPPPRAAPAVEYVPLASEKGNNGSSGS